MSTDRELTELAAKAAGLSIQWSESWGCHQRDARPVAPGYSEWVLWRPLSDAGDAMKLAVALSITVYHENGSHYAEYSDDYYDMLITMIESEGTALEATCRVIVGAAAEMAKSNELAEAERASTNPNKEAP